MTRRRSRQSSAATKPRLKPIAIYENSGEQSEQAYEKRDFKLVDELSDKIETLEKTLGPEYAALVEGLEQLDPENDKLGAEIMSEFAALNGLCTR